MLAAEAAVVAVGIVMDMLDVDGKVDMAIDMMNGREALAVSVEGCCADDHERS